MDDYTASMMQSLGMGQPGGLPIPRLITPEEVRSKALPLAQNIFTKWKTLHEIIVRHEATIQNRWTKKSKVKRRTLLLLAWPNMAQSHRPDIADWKRSPQTNSHATSVAANQDCYLWPHINLEDLTKTEPLLLMLNSRGRNAPDEFATADTTRLHFGIVTCRLDRPFLNCHVMMFRGRKTPETYGELYSYDDHEDAFTWDMEQRATNPGDGLLTLTAQSRIYDFLVRCCELILHDLSSEDLVDAPIKPEPPSASANGGEDGKLTSLATTALEAPYRLPARLDVARLRSIVAARVGEAEEHLWAMREDPGYFAKVLTDDREHRLECLPDTLGFAHPVTDRLHDHILWERLTGNVISSALANVEVFSLLRDELASLLRLQEEFEGTFNVEDDLPDSYEMAFHKLQHLLNQMMKGPISNLKNTVPSSPPLRRHFVRVPNNNPHDPKIKAMSRPEIPRSRAESELLSAMDVLWDDDRRFIMGPKTLADELGILTKTESEARDLISPIVATHISDLSLIVECLHQTHLYQPWAATFEDHAVQHQDALARDFTEKMKYVTGMFNWRISREMVDLAKPGGNRFSYPAHKRASKATVEAMRAAEANLDAFWNKCLPSLRNKEALSPSISRVLDRKPIRTPPWTESVLTKQPVDSKPDAQTANSGILGPFSGLGLGEEKPEKPAAVTMSTKAKTRGVAQPPTPRSTLEPDTTKGKGDDCRDRRFMVDRRALKVFDALFFTPSSGSQAGETNWTDFLHAMASTGFRAEKLGGSAWQFIPWKLNAERPIQFHEPHPSSKIPFLTARQMGRRLWRVYGWTRASFEQDSG